MDRYLMDHCLFFEEDPCDERVKTARGMWSADQQTDASRGFTSRFPQAKLDEFCEACPHGFFEVDEPSDPVCPVCREGLWNIRKNIIKEDTVNREKGAILIYRFDCPRCKKPIYSKTNLWA